MNDKLFFEEPSPNIQLVVLQDVEFRLSRQSRPGYLSLLDLDHLLEEEVDDFINRHNQKQGDSKGIAMKRKRDKFMQDMGRIDYARRRRNAQREHERLLDEDKSVWWEAWEDWHDGVEFRSQEFSTLGKEVVRGVANEARKVGKGILKEGADLALDFLVSAATLGLAEQPSLITRRNSRRRRR